MNSEPTHVSPEPASTDKPADRWNAGAGVVGFVRRLKESDAHRGALAVLRGALSTSDERRVRAYRLLAPFGGIPGKDAPHADVVRTVAGLMTLPNMRAKATEKNFGASCLKLLSKEERNALTKPEAPGPVARRVLHLLAASRDEVCDRVCAIARRIANKDGNIDFTVLYHDLCNWGPRTKAKWAGSFWGAAAVLEADDEEGDKA